MEGEQTERTPARARDMRPIEIRLAREDLPELAALIVGLLEERRRLEEPLVNAREVALFTGLSVVQVYRRGKDLGGFRLGDGPRVPWRWRLSEVEERYHPLWGWQT